MQRKDFYITLNEDEREFLMWKYFRSDTKKENDVMKYYSFIKK